MAAEMETAQGAAQEQQPPAPPPKVYASDILERWVKINAKPDAIFPLFTDPEQMKKWHGSEITLDAKAGGEFSIQTPKSLVKGDFVEVSPTKIIMNWGWEQEESPMPPGASRVEVTLIPNGQMTVMRLLHKNFPTRRLYDIHGERWTHYLNRLQQVAMGKDPGPDPGPRI